MCLAVGAIYGCHLVILANSLFVDAVNYRLVFHSKIISYCDETTITLIGFLKVGQVSESRAVFPNIFFGRTPFLTNKFLSAPYHA